ncbi:hypothetical protein CLUG_00405 [Clavispora lusitaniae ATCC 42720]|uniref:Uncharacterized protein n=1 Tax=Clavispora lusitaniae (strain ATCC 42720) TaxID=306902 RepID=C4XWT2_CLAL4|nr:uncharacterized protein CLUG_00405 [Clavispora lusitaniae ATCC 42720]EEQ36283.1 hypothetical protein CLUG_00405 [Clavispora lusitaniae ATCC 42720]
MGAERRPGVARADVFARAQFLDHARGAGRPLGDKVRRQHAQAENVMDQVVGVEGNTGIGHHAEDGGAKATVEVGERHQRRRHRLAHELEPARVQVAQRRVFGVHQAHNGPDAPAVVGDKIRMVRVARGVGQGAGLEGKPHAHQVERVGEKHRRKAGERAGHETACGGLVDVVGDENAADSLVGDKLDGRVGENAQKRHQVASEKAQKAVGRHDLAGGAAEPEERAAELEKLRVGRSEQDLDPVQRRYECFRRRPRDAASKARAQHVLGRVFVDRFDFVRREKVQRHDARWLMLDVCARLKMVIVARTSNDFWCFAICGACVRRRTVRVGEMARGGWVGCVF